MIGNYSMGGLKMTDIFAVNSIAKIKWIKSLISDPDQCQWQSLFLYLLNIDKNYYRISCHQVQKIEA